MELSFSSWLLVLRGCALTSGILYKIKLKNDCSLLLRLFPRSLPKRKGLPLVRHKTRIERLIDNAPLKSAHYKIWILSALGVFMDGLDLFIIAVALPLIKEQFLPSTYELGLIASASPLGAILGATLLGYCTDKMGRKKLYVGSMALFVVFSLLCAVAQNSFQLILFRFLLGIGIGADYPISSSYLSEFMPKSIRGRAVISAFSFQALGCIAGAALGVITLVFYPAEDAWRWMLGLTVFPALIIGILRMGLPESALWLQSKHQFQEAAQVVARVVEKPLEKILALVRTDRHLQQVELQSQKFFFELFSRKFLRQTLLTSVPWFIFDVCFYGANVFSAYILAVVFASHEKTTIQTQQGYLHDALKGVSGSLFIYAFLIVGCLASIAFIRRIGTIRLQNMGFLGMAIGLVILGVGAWEGNQQTALILAGFAFFNLMVNFGPNPTTYLLPTERFPPYIRASGHGFAASAGKIGAAVGIFFLPQFLQNVGIAASMFALAGCALLGLVTTAILGRQPLHAGAHLKLTPGETV